MASEIKVDTIVNAGGDNDTGIDLATNDQILLKVANATRLTMNSTGQTTIVGEGGSTTTSVQQGLGKFWSNWDGESTVATRDSFNQSGLTDNGTGDYTTAFTNNMGNDDYAHLCTASSESGYVMGIEREAFNTTSSCRSYSFTVSASVQDVQVAIAYVIGDLA